MATVTKNFRIKSGLIVEGTTGTINGQNILTETGGNAYILNLVGGATLVKSVDSGVFNVDGSGNLTVKANTFDAYGAASSAQTAAIAAAATDATTKANAAQSAAITAAATDATTKVAAEAALRVSGDAASVSTAAADATSKANAAQSAAISAAATDATTKANAAQAAAATDATNKVAAEATARNSAIATAKGEAISTSETYTDGKISDLINGAPTILDTLKEIADALTADEGTAATLATTVSGKVSKAGDTMSGNLAMGTNKVTGLGTPTAGTDATNKDYVDTANTNQSTALTTAIATAKSEAISTASSDATSKVAAEAALRVSGDAASVSTAAADATSKANAAQSAAISAAATDATTKANAAQTAAISAAATDATTKANAAQAAAESTAASALGLVKDGTTKFTAININDLVSERATQAVISSISAGTSVMSWASSSYASAKLLVKFATATHTQISEILLSLDSSNNIAITEFATVGTNGDLGATTATYSGGNVGISVSTVNANTTVTVIATLIK
jgi:hypothetical protein